MSCTQTEQTAPMTRRSPYALSDTLEQILSEHCAVQPPYSEARIAHLAAAVKTIADSYIDNDRGHDLFADPDLRAAYSAYYLPCNAVKLFPILREHERSRPLCAPRSTLRVLDLGCGPGTLLAGLLDYCAFQREHTDTGTALELTGIDRNHLNCSTARELITTFCSRVEAAPTVTALRLKAGNLGLRGAACVRELPESGFDLIMAGNVINELSAADCVHLAARLPELLDCNGTVIVIDPGTRRSFRKLMLFRDHLLSRNDMRLCAPCVQTGPCPLLKNSNAWCHEKLFWHPPATVTMIDRHTRFTKHKGLKFSYLVAARDMYSPPFADLTTDTAHWRVISYVIRSKGEERLYVCNGRERMLLRRLTRITGPASADFSNAERGDIIKLHKPEQRAGFMNIGSETVFHTVV